MTSAPPATSPVAGKAVARAAPVRQPLITADEPDTRTLRKNFVARLPNSSEVTAKTLAFPRTRLAF